MPERIVMKGLISAHVAVLLALLGSHGDAQTTADVGSVYTNLPVIPPVANCMAWARCQQDLIQEFMDPNCMTVECKCVAENNSPYIDCLKNHCPDNWQAIHDWDMKTCTDLGIDPSGNYTGPAIPTPTVVVAPDDGLSKSDKIAIGIGIGVGVPTIAVGLGSWLCAKRKRAKEPKGHQEDGSEQGGF